MLRQHDENRLRSDLLVRVSYFHWNTNGSRSVFRTIKHVLLPLCLQVHNIGPAEYDTSVGVFVVLLPVDSLSPIVRVQDAVNMESFYASGLIVSMLRVLLWECSKSPSKVPCFGNSFPKRDQTPPRFRH